MDQERIRCKSKQLPLVIQCDVVGALFMEPPELRVAILLPGKSTTPGLGLAHATYELQSILWLFILKVDVGFHIGTML